jgi:anti-sigma factor (TIGR02949 family)
MSDTRTLSCDEALRLLAEHLDGELDGARRDEVEAHLARCRSCFSRADFERQLKSRLAALRERAVEPTFEERIRTLMGQFAAVSEE